MKAFSLVGCWKKSCEEYDFNEECTLNTFGKFSAGPQRDEAEGGRL